MNRTSSDQKLQWLIPSRALDTRLLVALAQRQAERARAGVRQLEARAAQHIRVGGECLPEVGGGSRSQGVGSRVLQSVHDSLAETYDIHEYTRGWVDSVLLNERAL